jgi:predicted secreted protein
MTLPHDQTNVQLEAFVEEDNSSRAMQRINQKMQSVKEVLTNTQGIEWSTQTYTVRPQFDRNGKLKTWQARQTITIQSSIHHDLGKTLQRLEPFLNYRAMTTTISKHSQAQIYPKLLQSALKNYQRKANQIAQQFDHKHYQLISTQIIESGHHQPRPTVHSARALTLSESIEPVIQAGTETLTIEVSGILASTEK